MKCPSCGYENPDRARVCDLCKATLQKPLTAKQPAVAAAAKAAPVESATGEWRCVCGRANFPERGACIACGQPRPGSAVAAAEPRKPAPAPATAAAPAKAPNVEQLAVDARAQITWGKAPARVRENLIRAGVRASVADEVVNAAVSERNLSFRKKGLVDIFSGGGALLLVGALFALSKQKDAIVVPRGPHTFLVIGLAAIAGPLLLARGIHRLLAGGRAQGADSDVIDG